MTAASRERPEAAARDWLVFDVYGTLLDVDAAVREHEQLDALPPELSAVWRAKQLEYTWTLQAMGAYRDFWTVTGEALDYAIAATGARVASPGELRDMYLRLPAFAEVPEVLASLRDRDRGRAVLSNGTPGMLEPALEAAGILDAFDAVISVDEIGVYKPDPRVYAHALERLGAGPSQVRLVSANAWDVAGARGFGLRTIWVNRAARPPEYGIGQDGEECADLRGVLRTA